MNVADTAYYVAGGGLSSLALAIIGGQLLRRYAHPRARGGAIPATRPRGADLPGSLRTRIRLALGILRGDAVAYRLRLSEMPGSGGGRRFWMHNCTVIPLEPPRGRMVFHDVAGLTYAKWETDEPAGGRT